MGNAKTELSDIQIANIGKIDMNLLRVFEAVYRTSSVSRASEELGVSQPAASRAIGKLRLALKDALFVRTQTGVEPTPKAHRLAAPVAAAITALTSALLDTDAFDPMTTHRTFHLNLTDTGEALFLPELLERLNEIAPHARLQSFSTPREEIADALDSGRLDFAVGYLPDLAGTQSLALYQDEHVILLRKEHPLAGPPDHDTLASLEFVLVRPHLDTTKILQSLRLDHQVKVTVSHFLALPRVIQGSDLGAWIPARIARALFLHDGAYSCITPRLPATAFTVTLHWSRRFEHDAAHRWFRQQLLDLFSE